MFVLTKALYFNFFSQMPVSVSSFHVLFSTKTHNSSRFVNVLSVFCSFHSRSRLNSFLLKCLILPAAELSISFKVSQCELFCWMYLVYCCSKCHQYYFVALWFQLMCVCRCLDASLLLYGLINVTYFYESH